ncbi:hypothetical protein NKH77_51370 [Streptomyces sp. M19]
MVSVAATLFVRTLRLSGPGSYFVILVAALAAFLPPSSLTAVPAVRTRGAGRGGRLPVGRDVRGRAGRCQGRR